MGGRTGAVLLALATVAGCAPAQPERAPAQPERWLLRIERRVEALPAGLVMVRERVSGPQGWLRGKRCAAGAIAAAGWGGTMLETREPLRWSRAFYEQYGFCEGRAGLSRAWDVLNERAPGYTARLTGMSDLGWGPVLDGDARGWTWWPFGRDKTWFWGVQARRTVARRIAAEMLGGDWEGAAGGIGCKEVGWGGREECVSAYAVAAKVRREREAGRGARSGEPVSYDEREATQDMSEMLSKTVVNRTMWKIWSSAERIHLRVDVRGADHWSPDWRREGTSLVWTGTLAQAFANDPWVSWDADRPKVRDERDEEWRTGRSAAP